MTVRSAQERVAVPHEFDGKRVLVTGGTKGIGIPKRALERRWCEDHQPAKRLTYWEGRCQRGAARSGPNR